MIPTYSLDIFCGLIFCFIIASWTFYVPYAAAKATSTVCLIWSAYMLARTRPWRKPNSDSNEAALTEKDQRSQSPPIYNQQQKQHSDLGTNGESTQKFELLLVDTTLENPNDSSDTNPPSLNPSAGSRIRQNLLALYKLIHKPSEVTHTQSTITHPTKDRNCQELDYFYKFIGSIAEEACMRVNTNNLVHSLNRKIRLPGLSRNYEISSETLTRILIAYSKDPRFLDLLFDKPDTSNLISFLARCALNFASLSNSSVQPSPSSISIETPNTSLSNCSDTDSNSNVIDLNRSSHLEQTTFEASTTNSSVDNHPEYPLHLYLATLVANLSRHPKSHTLGLIEDLNKLLVEWTNSPSLHLVLLSSKIRHNLQTFTHLSATELSDPNESIIYYPDIYRLDVETDSKQKWDFDVIFVNGMLGSVFYTWRQSESALNSNQSDKTPYTKCWPRDWLSSKFPNARIIGIDASLKPFVWNSICPMRKFRRSLDSRALDIMNQLQFAGIGRRPVIWVTHSAGGILVKEMLRLAKLGINTQSNSWELNTSIDTPSSPNSSIHDDGLPRWPSLEDGLETNPTDLAKSDQPDKGIKSTKTESDHKIFHPTRQSFILTRNIPNNLLPSPTYLPPQRSSQIFTRQSSFSSEFSNNTEPTITIDFEQLADQTKGVVFISVPHRGNQSLFALYRRPFRWALTPEAIQLERNSEYLLDLHVWFNLWSFRHNVKVLSMAEKRLTAVNRFWSVLLVPEDSRDREMGSLVAIDADHLYISKPQTPSDLAYTSLIDFIHSLPFFQSSDSLLSPSPSS